MTPLGYWVTLALLPLPLLCAYQDYHWLDITDFLLFYIRLSSAFLSCVFLVLCWSYAGIAVRKRTISAIRELGYDALAADTFKISQQEIMKITGSNIQKFLIIENCRFKFYGIAMPFAVLFLEAASMFCLSDAGNLQAIAIATLIEITVIAVFLKIENICKIEKHKVAADNFMKNIIGASRGITCYFGERLVLKKFDDASKELARAVRRTIDKSAQKGLLCLAALFCLISATYIINDDCLAVRFDSIGGLFFLALLFCAISFSAFLKYLKIRSVRLESLVRFGSDENTGSKDLDKNNLFVAFHGVYFRDITAQSGTPFINDLTFSILPGEFLVATGENVLATTYMFDLLLRFAKPQAGNVYVSGITLDNVRLESLRRVIGFFKQDFGLFDGTVYDNLRLTAAATESEDKLEDVASRMRIQDDLDKRIYADSGDIAVSQAILFKIQEARLFMLQPKILLIEMPEYFEDEETEQMFIDFVERTRPKKTVIVATKNLRFIIYSDKIIYFKKDGMAAFGTHASLASDPDYQRYIMGLQETRI